LSKTLDVGQKGEKQAALYLRSLGYEILENNWRFKKAEIDIIARRDDILVFVEVKTRASEYFGKPEEFISKRQASLIIDAASQYMVQIEHEAEFRFDIISIIMIKGILKSLNHFEDAFFPGLN